MGTKKTMKLSEIRVPDVFLSRRTDPAKIQDRVKKFKSKGPFGIYVNKDGWLSDGYASYQAAQRLGLDEVPVSPGADEVPVVYGTHWDPDKEYCWAIPGHVAKRLAKAGVEIRPGMHMAAMTSRGVSRMRVTRLGTAPWPHNHKNVLGLWDKDHAAKKKSREGCQDGE